MHLRTNGEAFRLGLDFVLFGRASAEASGVARGGWLMRTDPDFLV